MKNIDRRYYKVMQQSCYLLLCICLKGGSFYYRKLVWYLFLKRKFASFLKFLEVFFSFFFFSSGDIRISKKQLLSQQLHVLRRTGLYF